MAVIPVSPNADKEAKAARADFLQQIKEQRNLRTNSTVDQLPVWVAMTTGARRELYSVRWFRLALEEGRETLWLRQALTRSQDGWIEGNLKTHQRRRIALVLETAAVLREHRELWTNRLAALGHELDEDAYVISSSPDCSNFAIPYGISQRFERLVARLGIRTTFHKLRHYSATELIVGGVHIRTVADQLGHTSGGTTLQTYTAWVSEADQRAATGLVSRMPSWPGRHVPKATDCRASRVTSPRGSRSHWPNASGQGNYRPVNRYPRWRTLPRDTQVRLAPPTGCPPSAPCAVRPRFFATGDSRRAYLDKRARVVAISEPTAVYAPPSTVESQESPQAGHGYWTWRFADTAPLVARFSAEVDPRSAIDLRELLMVAIRRGGDDESQVKDYELIVRDDQDFDYSRRCSMRHRPANNQPDGTARKDHLSDAGLTPSETAPRITEAMVASAADDRLDLGMLSQGPAVMIGRLPSPRCVEVRPSKRPTVPPQSGCSDIPSAKYGAGNHHGRSAQNSAQMPSLSDQGSLARPALTSSSSERSSLSYKVQLSTGEQMDAFGDIAMNLGDQFYPLARNDTLSKTRLENVDVLARLLAYAVMAESITFPARYALSDGPLYNALRTSPQLLTSGIVRIAIYEGLSSFEELVRDHGYPDEALPRASWLDEHVVSKRIYKPEDHGNVFMATILADMAPTGGLRRLVPGGRRGAAAAQVDRIAEYFASGPADRRRISEAASAFLPKHSTLIRRWAAMRYYTIPLLFDNPGCIRELPKSAAKLVEAIEAVHSGHTNRASRGLEEAAPLNPMVQQLLIVPALRQSVDPSSINLVVDAMLEIRERHKTSRRRFLKIVGQLPEVSADLHQAFQSEMARQERLSSRVSQRTRAMPWIGVSIGLASTAAGLGLPLDIATALGVATSVLPTATDSTIGWIQDKKRPWVLAHEDVSQTLSKKKFLEPSLVS